LIDFDSLSGQDVLEIGVGNGSHAQLISSYAGTYTGIDLTTYAVKSTRKRLAFFATNHLAQNTTVMRMDAECMGFADESFDLVWSWGVIHHSANTRRILEEIHRVLRPGGTAITMVYQRNFWNYYLMAGLFRGILQRRMFKAGSVHNLRQELIDGAIARYYSRAEWRKLVSDFFFVEDLKIYGSKLEMIPLPSGRAKKTVQSLMPDALGRFLTNRCMFGMFLVTKLRK
jgi:ubiquinone/menaquinone biosynthesis C-methylase UbiE